MKIQENPVAATDLLDRAHAAHEAKVARVPGVHASDLIYCQLAAWYKHGPRRWRYPEPVPTQNDKLTWLIGAGYHEMLQGFSLPNRREITREFSVFHLDVPDVRHGHQIHVTLDLLDDDMILGDIITEVKSTRGSTPSNIWSKSPAYIEQALTYALAWRHLRARVAVVYINGTWKPPTPEFKVWDVEVDPDEMIAWESELARRACYATNSPEPVRPDRYDWECGYCAYAPQCPWPEKAKGRDGDKTGIKKTGFFVVDEPPDWIGEHDDGTDL